jgi:Domain of unknown function (DUF6883)
MTVPNADRAIIAVDKLTAYLLNMSHKRGAAKARLLLGLGYRSEAVRDALAFRQARHTRYPDKVESERVLYSLEGLASYTQTVLVAPSQTDAIARGLELLAGAEDGESFVRTFTYNSGPA